MECTTRPRYPAIVSAAQSAFWGLIIAAIGVLFIAWGRTRSDFVVYRLLAARAVIGRTLLRTHGNRV